MFRSYLRSLRNLRARTTPNHRRFTSKAKINNPSNDVLTKKTAACVTVFTASSLLLASTVVFADNGVETIKESSLGSLVRAYAVYTMCSVPALVDASPRLLAFLTSIPVVKQITEAFVRITFFNQFVGGDTAIGALPLLRSIRSANKGILFAYSVEVDEKKATDAHSDNSPHLHVSRALPTHKRILDEMLHCIDVVADFEEGLMSELSSVKGRRTWVAIKMTALLPDANALHALSSSIVESRKDPRTPVGHAAIPFPGSARIEDLNVILKPLSTNQLTALTPAQISGVRELYDNLVKICTRAQERGIKIIIDAEYRYVALSFL